MFGYIMINKPEMKCKDYEMYHSFYCGLCQALKQRNGRAGQLTLSYDLTFVTILLTSLYESETKLQYCRCIAHPGEKHASRTNAISSYAADMNVLLSIYKCEDDWLDEKKLSSHLFGKMLRLRGKKHLDAYSEKEARICDYLQQLHDLEHNNCQEVDLVSDLFGHVMEEIFLYHEDEWSEVLRMFGFYLGKLIYLLDAYEDLEKDRINQQYNPLLSMSQNACYEENCRSIFTMLMGECCKYFEQLPLLAYVDILRNILYSGIWTKYEIVHAKVLEKE